MNIAPARNFIKNTAMYAYNTIPQSSALFKKGKSQGRLIASKNEYGNVKTALFSGFCGCKKFFKQTDTLKLPLLGYGVTMPIPIPIISTSVLLGGYTLCIPTIIKRIRSGELSISKIKNFIEKMIKKDAVKPYKTKRIPCRYEK